MSLSHFSFLLVMILQEIWDFQQKSLYKSNFFMLKLNEKTTSEHDYRRNWRAVRNRIGSPNAFRRRSGNTHRRWRQLIVQGGALPTSREECPTQRN